MTPTGAALDARLAAALRRCEDREAVASTVCRVLRAQVPYVFGCLATTDPATGLIGWTYKTHSLKVGDEEFAAAEYGAPDVNQFAEIARRADPVGVLSVDTGGDVEQCRRMREFLTPRFGFRDELRVVFRAQDLTWGALAVYRAAGEPPFSVVDARAVAAAHETIAQALRRVMFADHVSGPAPTSGPAVLVVSAAGEVRALTPAARTTIDELGGWDHGSLPSSVLALVVRARTAPECASSRVRGVTGQWLTLRAATTDGLDHDVVVTLEPARSADISSLTLAARGLTAREQEVAGLVLQGASTRAIAAALHLSPHTVQDHLKSIFGKLGVNSRRDMIGRLALP